MDPGFDFYAALKELLSQIPENCVTTVPLLAEALGDPVAEKAVAEALKRRELRAFSKLVDAHRPDGVFSDFSSDKPLGRLAEFQKTLAKRVIVKEAEEDVRRVAGVDAAYQGDDVWAVCAVVDLVKGASESYTAISKASFPYIPGYLAFREGPAFLSAIRKASGFDAILVNGHGIAHPRGCGLATCVGLQIGVPTIGVARRRLFGDVEASRGEWAPVVQGGKIVGSVLREQGKAPLYVSVGHMISLERSVELVRELRADGGLPEPLRLAHQKAEHERQTSWQAAHIING